MYVVIAGCGRLGSGLARVLSSEGCDVAVIDRPMDRRLLGGGFDGIVVDGDPIDRSALESAGVGKADLFVAATSNDNVNASAVQAAKAFFSVPRAIARFADPERESFYKGLGYDTICPTATGINQVLDFIRNGAFSPLGAVVDPNMTCVFPNEGWVGSRLRDIKPPSGRRFIGLVRGTRFYGAGEPVQVRQGDSVVISRRK
jgi:trk system potassium uptake protein